MRQNPGISIHALLAESDLPQCNASCNYRSISIHALLAESDSARCWKLDLFFIFLSTLSLRRATKGSVHDFKLEEFLSTLSLRRATCDCSFCPSPQVISIHALLAESDLAYSWLFAWIAYFYPRSPCGERRSMALTLCFYLCWYFYPRSPCGERPLLLMAHPVGRKNFYPRSPCGERQHLLII